jgi:hypothetical protein
VKEDFLHDMYFLKRAAFLSHLMDALSCANEFQQWKFTFEYFHGDDRSFVLQMLSPEDGKHPFSSDLASLKHFRLQFDRYSILADSRVRNVDERFRSTFEISPSIKEASILGRLWLSSRGLGSSIYNGGFGGFEWQCLLLFLVENRCVSGDTVMSHRCSAFELFKGCLQYLADLDIIEYDDFLESGNAISMLGEHCETFGLHSHGDVFFKVSKHSIKLVSCK